MARPERKYLQIRIPVTLLEDLNQFAEEDLKSMNSVIVEILEEYARKRKARKRKL